jgi:8-oxo-dGTP pyrophosphatase MutT (NUDIX family)
VPDHPRLAPSEVLRHFTVAVFVVDDGRLLLHFHAKLGKWLPPGGHIEANELPDEAAVREVIEETGVRPRLLADHGLPIDVPRQLARPAGIQVEDIYPGHQHIDLVYFAVAEPGSTQIGAEYVERDRVGWYRPAELAALGASDEIQAWSQKALDALSTAC